MIKGHRDIATTTVAVAEVGRSFFSVLQPTPYFLRSTVKENPVITTTHGIKECTFALAL
jgi:hypothetical protein